MSGIYIHIPFCKKACIYCDFHFSTSRNYSEIIDSILTQIQLNQKKIKKNKISTIYFAVAISLNLLKYFLIELELNHIYYISNLLKF